MKIKVSDPIFESILLKIYINFINNIPNECLRKTNDSSSKEFIYDEQINSAKLIFIAYLTSGSRLTMLRAQMQSGKTGCCCAVINIYTYIQDNYNDTMFPANDRFNSILSVKDFSFVTGMDQTGLKEQTIDRFIQINAYVMKPEFYNDKEELKGKIDMIENYDRYETIINKNSPTTEQAYNKYINKCYDTHKFSIQDFTFYHELGEKGKLTNYSKERINEIYTQYNEILNYDKNSDKYTFNYYKNSDLRTYLKNNQLNLKNVQIFIDESQYGLNEHNTVNKAIEQCEIDLRNTFQLNQKNCSIITISATPFDEQKAESFSQEPDEFRNKITLELGSHYIGAKEYKAAGCLRESMNNDFDEDENGNYPIIEYIKNAENTRLNKDEFAYFIVRVPNTKEGIIRDNTFIKDNFDTYLLTCGDKSPIDYDNFNYRINNKSKKMGLIESSILEKSKKPIIFIIKGAFRAGNTIEEKFKKYCRMAYDNSKGIEAGLQGLFGRYNGYRSNLYDYKNTIIYTKLDHVEKYIDWIDSNFSDEKIPIANNNKNNSNRKLACKSLRNGFEIILNNNELNILRALNNITINQKPETFIDRNNYINEILLKNGVVKTNNEIINPISNIEFNYINKYLINEKDGFEYSKGTANTSRSLTAFSGYEEKEHSKANYVIINIYLVDNKFLIQRGILYNKTQHKVKKSKEFLIANKHDYRYRGPIKK